MDCTTSMNGTVPISVTGVTFSNNLKPGSLYNACAVEIAAAAIIIV